MFNFLCGAAGGWIAGFIVAGIMAWMLFDRKRTRCAQCARSNQKGLKTNMEFNEAHLHGLQRARYLLTHEIHEVEITVRMQQEDEERKKEEQSKDG